MKYEIKIPEVGESITEVTLAQWLKNDGDYVKPDELICEIESEKASFEIPAEQGGILKRLAAEGETIGVGETVAVIETDRQADAAQEPPEAASPQTEATLSESATEPVAAASNGTPVPVVVPEVGESINEVTIAQWLKSDGETVAEGDLLCEIESEKASFELPAETSGILKILTPEGETVSVGAKIAEVLSGGASAARAEPAADSAPSAPQAAPAQDGDHRAKATPVAARILAEAGLSPEQVKGSGAGGRITKEDALQAAAQQKTAPQPAQTPASPPPRPQKEPAAAVEPPVAGNRTERRERMSTLRKTIARRLVAAKNQTAMLTTFNEIDMSSIKKLRAQYKEIFKEKHQVGLGFMSFFTRAVVLALQEWPAVNAMIDEDHIIYHDYCDISIAVSSPRGLVVPVIRNAEKLSLAEIEKEVARLAERARNNQLTIEEMTGGTFTISNGGVFGSLMSTPIINAPQSAILGMHKIEDRPVVINGEIAIRPMMYVALSYDHRIIDGRESVSFLVRVKEYLEDPARMLLRV